MINRNFLNGIFICLFILLLSCSSNTLKNKSAKEKEADLYYGQGTYELMNKQYPQALQHLLMANESDPNNSKILNNLAMAYYFKKQSALSQETLKKALEVDPKNSDARNNLASIHLEMKQFAQAEQEYLTILKDLTYQHQYRTYYNLALISMERKNNSEAIERLKLALNDRDDYCPAHYQLGELYEKEYRYQQAYEQYTQGSKSICYSNVATHYKQALMLLEMRQYQKARLKLQDIVEKFPTSNYAEMANLKLKKLPQTSQTAGAINTEELRKKMLNLPTKNQPPEKFESPTF
ncbi:MAG: tetratricopeptide repeat protein [Pseudomonadota bacterium]